MVDPQSLEAAVLQGEHPEHKGKSDPRQLAIVERYFAEIMYVQKLQARVECFLFTRQFDCNARRVSGSCFAVIVITWAVIAGAVLLSEVLLLHRPARCPCCCLARYIWHEL